MKRRQVVAAIGVLVACPVRALGQTSRNVPRVVVLHAGVSTEPASQQREPFERGLREAGWIPGNNLLVDYRYAEGKAERLPDLAREAAASGARVIVARGPSVVAALHRATSTIPVVMLVSDDPVADGYVKSLARPGTNMTGILGEALALDSKRLELLKEAFPRVTRVAVLTNPSFDGQQFDDRVAQIQASARSLKMQAQIYKVAAAADITEAFALMTKAKTEALLVRPDPQILDRSRGEIAALAAKHRLPAVYPWRFFVESSGLMSYSINFSWMHTRSAVYVSRILKGENPAEMPVERPLTYELAINVGTAKALGIEIPKAVLFRADALIH